MSNPFVSDHAVERYIERVKPALGEEHAKREITALALMGRPADQPPAWARNLAHYHDQRYLIVTDDIVFPVKSGRVLTTCLVRSVA